MLKAKSSVRPFNLHIVCAFVNAALELGILHDSDETLPDLVITSGIDSAHRPGSAHYDGNALDFRTKNLTPKQKFELRDRVKERLGAAYDSILEDLGGPNEHLHVERDPVRGGLR